MGVIGRYLDPALVEQLNHLQLSARSVTDGAAIGLHRSPLKGASIEFRQHRSYVPGDEPRRLDWRVLGRTDRPYIKEYDQETNLRCLILLDRSGSMAYRGKHGSKFDYAARLVAAIAYLALGQAEAVGLALFSGEMDEWLAPHGSTAQLPRVLEMLERATPRGPSSPAVAMHASAERLERRSLVVIVSDFFSPIPELRSGFAHLRHDRHEVVALQVLDPDEREFPFRRWIRFKGLENEPAELVEPAIMRDAYLKNFQRHADLLDESARALSLSIQSIPTTTPTIEALKQFLMRRSAGRKV